MAPLKTDVHMYRTVPVLFMLSVQCPADVRTQERSSAFTRMNLPVSQHSITSAEPARVTCACVSQSGQWVPVVSSGHRVGVVRR